MKIFGFSNEFMFHLTLWLLIFLIGAYQCEKKDKKESLKNIEKVYTPIKK